MVEKFFNSPNARKCSNKLNSLEFEKIRIICVTLGRISV